MPPRRSSKTNNRMEISALQGYIRNLRQQLTTSYDDLDRLQSFINQPLFDEPMVRGYAARTAYTIARQKIAIEYARGTLKSISDVVTIIGTNISDADGRLRVLEDGFGEVFPKTNNMLYRVFELVEDVWDLYDTVERGVGLAEIGVSSG